MNLQTHGQISGQVPNQAGTMLPGIPQPNGNPVPSQMQNPSVNLNTMSIDPEFVQTRTHMQRKIWELLMQKCPQSHELPNRKLLDIVKRLEDGLFRSATTKEEYTNLATLANRLQILIRRPSMSNQNQQLGHANSSPPIGTMIPTPGFQQTGNSNLVGTSSVDSFVTINRPNAIAPLGVNSGNFLPTRNGSSGSLQVMGQSDPPQTGEGRSNNITREKQFKNQQRWLLFLRHARRCPAPEGKCHYSNCLTVQKLLKHMEHCSVFQCIYSRCRATKILVNHHGGCRDESCPVCIPVKNFVQAQLKQRARSDFNTELPRSINGSSDHNDTVEECTTGTFALDHSGVYEVDM